MYSNYWENELDVQIFHTVQNCASLHVRVAVVVVPSPSFRLFYTVMHVVAWGVDKEMGNKLTTYIYHQESQ